MITVLRCLGLAALLGLAACKGGDDTALKDKAGGEILPGSASDAMLPLDTVRSQPPLAPHSESAVGKRKSNTGDDTESGPESAPPEAAPASSAPPAD